MNSNQIQQYREQSSHFAGIESSTVNLLAKSVASYLDSLSLILNGRSWPEADLSNLSISLLLLSDAANEMPASEERRSLDYLIAMGFEQSGDLLSRELFKDIAETYPPLENDLWYRLVLSFLHYMAGGFRVQALCVLRHLNTLSNELNSDRREQYEQLVNALWNYFQGSERTRTNLSIVNDYLTGEREPSSTQFAELRIYRLSNRFREMKEAALDDLGMGKEDEWLSFREILSDSSSSLWGDYLKRLKDRHFTNFTSEQIGQGFDSWLLPNTNLLVLLPTGSGKTLIGELMTALTLAQGFQVVWMLPTRALVRQTKRELSDAFESLGVDVDELPITEDYIPQELGELSEIAQRRLVAVSTPEKVAALIRSNKNAVSNVRLVVLDEAQILLENRGTTAEYVLQEIHRLCPSCKFVFMSAFADVEDRLRSFLNRLVGQSELAKELISRNRPTRRIYGVITGHEYHGKKHPLISIYPPQLFSEETTFTQPYKIFFDHIKLNKKSGGIQFAVKVSKAIIGTSLRAVMFVNTVASAEKQALTIAHMSRKNIKLPDYDLSRLKVELGRQSLIEITGQKGVAPHHGSLAPLEQHIVEKWTKKEKIINLVVATPTLAQGVNLPFDLSIVSFVKRSKQDNPQVLEDVPIPEIMNMLGRAGRAGQVSDGLCLITAPIKSNDSLKVLLHSRKFFFRTNERSRDFLGLAKLLRTALDAKINEKNWLFEMSGMNIDQAQTLISFSMQSAIEVEGEKAEIIERLLLFPSIQDLKELYDDSAGVLKTLSENINPLIQNILLASNNDRVLLEVISRTGLPIEVLRYFIHALRNSNEQIKELSSTEISNLADDIVFGSLEKCLDRDWYKRFVADIDKNISLEKIKVLINLWRDGYALANIESNVGLDRKAVGKFISRKLSLFAQFWGALAVCYDELYPDEQRNPFDQLQMCIREGVNSIQELIWLNHLGDLDRVLAHKLASIMSMDTVSSDRQSISKFVKERLRRWKQKRELIPIELSVDEVGALNSIFNER